MKILQCEQMSPEWLKARCGVPSASNFDKIVTSKGSLSKQAEKYMFTLAGEKVTGFKEETYQNFTMQRGIELEAEARSFYELTRDVKVEQVGFCMTDNKTIGCSPDGLVGEDGLIEIKCPIISTHVFYLLKNEELLKSYFQQVQGQLFVTERKWVDLISYYPAMRPLIIRVERDEAFLRSLEKELNIFCKKLNEVFNKIK